MSRLLKYYVQIIAKNLRFLLKLLLVFAKKDHDIGFWEKRQFFVKNWKKSLKIVITTSTPGRTKRRVVYLMKKKIHIRRDQKKKQMSKKLTRRGLVVLKILQRWR
jgi:hypothetical protein